MMISLCDRVENTVGKGKNVFYLASGPLPDDKILDRPKLKQSADDNFKFGENSRKFSKQVENTVGKGEIAGYKQFLLFPQCFQKACFPGASKGVIVREWVKRQDCVVKSNAVICERSYIKVIKVQIASNSKQWWCLTSFPIKPFLFTCMQRKSLENTTRKGEIDCNKQFLLFSHCFPLLL